MLNYDAYFANRIFWGGISRNLARQNPVRAKMVKAPEQYRWSSYRVMLGLAQAVPGLTVDWVLGSLPRRKPWHAGVTRTLFMVE